MDSRQLIESFAEFARIKRIERPMMIKILEDVFRTIIRRQFNSDENFDVIINPDQGDLEIMRFREIVATTEDVEDENLQIPLAQARKIEADFTVGEEVAEPIKFEDFGRRLVLTARQTLMQKVRDLEKEKLYEKYKEFIGEIITGEVYQTLKRELIIQDMDGSELSLPRNEQIPGERYRKGDTVRAVVERADYNNGNPKIILSRTSPLFLEKLFETEIPEVYDGLIMVRKAVREPGDRAKVAVESYDERIDPVGACVGMKGSRIHSIVRELRNENIDVINYTDNIELLISRALSPAKVTSVRVDEENKHASVFLRRDQISMAIGKGGQNIRLASKLVGLEIDVFRDDYMDDVEDDIDLTEFDDVLEEWVIEVFRSNGFDSARSILDASKEDLIRLTDLEEETIDRVIAHIKHEFEQEEAEEELPAEEEDELLDAETESHDEELPADQEEVSEEDE